MFFVFSKQANGGLIARYASVTSSNTATRVLHCNKLLFINSLFLIIFNNLYIMYCEVQILAFQQESASCLFVRWRISKNCLKKIRELRAKE